MIFYSPTLLDKETILVGIDYGYNFNLNDYKEIENYVIGIYKEIFRILLEIDSYIIKDKTASVIKEIYDKKIFNKHDIFDIAKKTKIEKNI